MSEEETIADGQDHALDPRVIPMRQVAGGLFIAAIAAVSLVFVTIRWLTEQEDATWPLLLAWLVLAALGAWSARAWPARSYRHTSYRVDDRGIEIRKGVWWRVVINVPRSRVQHIDVTQGPIDRRYGLGTLVVYTAGTDHAKVELGGLEHGRALGIREHLLPPAAGVGAGDAV